MKPHEVYDITTHNLWNSLQITKTESESYTKVLIEKYSGLARLVVSRASLPHRNGSIFGHICTPICNVWPMYIVNINGTE